MKKIVICFLVLLTVCSTVFSQTSIDEEILDNFYEYRGEIADYFSYYFREDYSNDMLYYNGRLMTIFGNIVDRRMISDEIIDFIIELYNKTLSLDVPDEDAEMYIEAGLGENGHELYTKILSIMYFMDLEKNASIFSQNDQIIIRNNISKLKKLFTQEEWDITVRYFNTKYNE
jgi:hypothetical protein